MSMSIEYEHIMRAMLVCDSAWLHTSLCHLMPHTSVCTNPSTGLPTSLTNP